jgi:DnaJ-class molecular chaperone
MGKVDAKHDYYADLDCKPNADAAEIKKAFKKLGE